MRGATFSAAELRRAPNVVSLLRVPLAIAFPFLARSTPAAVAVLALAGATDVLDGHLARRLGAVTALGAVIDPVADKLFALSAMGTLVALQKLPWWGVPALLAREILEVPVDVADDAHPHTGGLAKSSRTTKSIPRSVAVTHTFRPLAFASLPRNSRSMLRMR